MNLIEARDYHLREVGRIRGHSADHPTLRLYGMYERRHLEYLDANRIDPDLHMLNPAVVAGCQLWIHEHHGYGTRGGRQAELAYSRIMKIWSAFLAKRRIIPADLMLGFELPHVPKVRRRPFTADEAQAIMAAVRLGASPVRDRAIMLLLSDTGCRVGELCGLELQDVLAGDGSLRPSIAFRKTKGGIARDVMVQQPTRSGGRCLEALRAWLRTRTAQPGVLNVFTTHDGWPLSERRVRELHRLYGTKARVEGSVSPHRWRHAQPLHSPVLTPHGWSTMGQLRVGDMVIGSDGNPTPVLGVYPQGSQPIVRIAFTDGASVECTLDHLWAARRRKAEWWPRNKPPIVMSTAALIDSSGVWLVPSVKPVEFGCIDDETLPIHPYVLGALLGDGHIGHNVEFGSHPDETEVIGRIRAVLPESVTVAGEPGHYRLIGLVPHSAVVPRTGTTGHRRPDLNTETMASLYLAGKTGPQIAALVGASKSTITRRLRRIGVPLRLGKPTVNVLMDAARELGIYGKGAVEKAIPPMYLLASVDARRELLRGLMDTDGDADDHGCANFTTISPQLAAGVQELVRSLGGISFVRHYKPYRTAKNTAYKVTVRTPFTPFHMTRKRQRFESARMKAGLCHTIAAIEPVGIAECVCIQVANTDGLYVTQDYVLTHNSAASEALAEGIPENSIRDRLGHLSRASLDTYIHLSDRTRAVAAERASLSEKWRL